MNLFYGEFVSNEEIEDKLDILRDKVVTARECPPLSAETVIAACEKLLDSIDDDFLVTMIEGQGISHEKALREVAQARSIMSRETLERRVALELKDYGKEDGVSDKIRILRRPLGTLFHIAAGNLDVLPAFSVIEGLLSGNINILKLPSGVDDLSITIMKQLTDIEPELIPYIYVFDFPSTDIEMMKKLAELSDAVVVWGGAEAVKTVRSLAKPDTRIIEWGHKLSFAYVSGEVSDEALSEVAYNICDTNGLLCSSCQGVFVDTDDDEELKVFAGRFLEILKKEVPLHDEIKQTSIKAQKSLEMYTEAIESLVSGKKEVLRGEGCGIIVKHDSLLEPSYGFRNIWVKPLTSEKMVRELSGYKGFLQTAALICPDTDRERLTELLINSGVNRITSGLGMSSVLDIEPHDGLLPLSEYSRLVTVEKVV